MINPTPKPNHATPEHAQKLISIRERMYAALGELGEFAEEVNHPSINDAYAEASTALDRIETVMVRTGILDGDTLAIVYNEGLSEREIKRTRKRPKKAK